MTDEIADDIRRICAELRQLFDEVRAERYALLKIVVSHGDLATLCAVADLLEAQKVARREELH